MVCLFNKHYFPPSPWKTVNWVSFSANTNASGSRYCTNPLSHLLKLLWPLWSHLVDCVAAMPLAMTNISDLLTTDYPFIHCIVKLRRNYHNMSKFVLRMHDKQMSTGRCLQVTWIILRPQMNNMNKLNKLAHTHTINV